MSYIGALIPIPNGAVLTCEVVLSTAQGVNLCGREAVSLVLTDGKPVQCCERHPEGRKA